MFQLFSKRGFVGLVIIPLAIFAFCSTPDLGLAQVVWVESVDGDLDSTILPQLEVGVNHIIGSVQSFGDRDLAQFMVPAGMYFDQFLIVALPGMDFRGPSMSINAGTFENSTTLEFINMAPFHSLPFDLLQFDSAPGPQPPGTYNFNIVRAFDATGDYEIHVIVAEGEVSTEASSWGGLKAIFRQ